MVAKYGREREEAFSSVFSASFLVVRVQGPVASERGPEGAAQMLLEEAGLSRKIQMLPSSR